MININSLEKRPVFVHRNDAYLTPECSNAGIYVFWEKVPGGYRPCYIGKANGGQVLKRRIPEQLSHHIKFGTMLRTFSKYIGKCPFTDYLEVIDWIEENILISVHPIEVYYKGGIDLKLKERIKDMEKELINIHRPKFNKQHNPDYVAPPRAPYKKREVVVGGTKVRGKKLTTEDRRLKRNEYSRIWRRNHPEQVSKWHRQERERNKMK